jgi:hypothetical protein
MVRRQVQAIVAIARERYAVAVGESDHVLAALARSLGNHSRAHGIVIRRKPDPEIDVRYPPAPSKRLGRRDDYRSRRVANALNLTHPKQAPLVIYLGLAGHGVMVEHPKWTQAQTSAANRH